MPISALKKYYNFNFMYFAKSQASAAVELNSSISGLLRSVGWFRADVSGLLIGPETSFLNQPTLPNNPYDGIIDVFS
jgi:hypothetical protein